MPTPKQRYRFPMHFKQGLAKVTVYKIASRPGYFVYTVAASIAGQGRTRKTFADPDTAVDSAKKTLKKLVRSGAHLLCEVPAERWNYYQQQDQRLDGASLGTAVDFFLTHNPERAHKSHALAGVGK